MKFRIILFLSVVLLGGGVSSSALAQMSETHEARVELQDAPVAIACPVALPSRCLEAGSGNVAAAQVQFSTQFLSLEALCFTVRFEGDLLDADEAFLIDTDADPNVAFGYTNLGSTALSERTVCVAQDSWLAVFLDGEPDMQVFRIFMLQGSATISSVEVVAIGVAANVTPRRGCGDKNHVHGREAECKKLR